MSRIKLVISQVLLVCWDDAGQLLMSSLRGYKPNPTQTRFLSSQTPTKVILSMTATPGLGQHVFFFRVVMRILLTKIPNT